jgi:hypothetical protein
MIFLRSREACLIAYYREARVEESSGHLPATGRSRQTLRLRPATAAEPQAEPSPRGIATPPARPPVHPRDDAYVSLWRPRTLQASGLRARPIIGSRTRNPNEGPGQCRG